MASRPTRSGSSKKRAFLKKFIGANSVTKCRREARKMHVERLEDRRYMASDLSSTSQQSGPPPALEFPLQTGRFSDFEAYKNYWGAYQAWSNYGGGPDYPDGYGGATSGSNQSASASGRSAGTTARTAEGLNQNVVVNEFDASNNLNGSGQVVPINSTDPNLGTAVIFGSLASSSSGIADIDHYTLNLRGGDIFDVRYSSGIFGLVSLQLVDSSGSLLAQSLDTPGDSYGVTNPLTTDGSISYAYVIPRDGTYQLRVSGAEDGAYEIRTRVLRNPIESEIVGTMPEIFLDFDGALVNRTEFGFSGLFTGVIADVPALQDSFSTGVFTFNFSAAEYNQMIDLIVSQVVEDFNGSIPVLGANGDFINDGVAGNFAVRVTNSRDHGDRSNLPHVTHVVVGGSAIAFFESAAAAGIIGVAPNIDVGNFDTTQTVMVFASDHAAFGVFTPRTNGATVVQVLAENMSDTISHEVGHSLGLWHTNPFNNIDTMMDPFAIPVEGPDGIYGNADDIELEFTPDEYRIATPLIPGLPGEFLVGFEDQAATVSHNLVSGTRGAKVTGLVYNDRNRNSSYQTSEGGLSGQTVYVDTNNNSQLDTGELRTRTGSDGTFAISIPPGATTIRLLAGTGFVLTAGSAQVSGSIDQVIPNVRLGQAAVAQPINGYKWKDIDGDGIRDEGEPGIGDVYIYADLDGDDRPDLNEPGTLTRFDGSFTLEAPSSDVSASYAIREVIGPGFVQTFPASGEHIITASTPRPLTGINFGNQPARDFGDLPSPFRTTEAANGASHGVRTGLSLGVALDVDADGLPTANARGDDNTNVDDEDGVLLQAPLVVGANNNRFNITVTNTTGAEAYLQGWMDFNGDGDFNDVNEQIIRDRVATTGGVLFSIPRGSVVGNVPARFRISTDTGVGPNGAVDDGEVEDYIFQTLSVLRYTLPDSFDANRNSSLGQNVFDVRANDPISSYEGFTSQIISVSKGTRGGTVTTNGDIVRYKPPTGFVGTDVFTYRLRISNGVVVTETVMVDVDFRFNSPQGIDDSYDVSVNSDSIPLDVLGNDAEGQNGELTIDTVSTPSEGGTATISSNGRRINYRPAPGFEGTETFTYRGIDSSGARTATTRVTIHVLPGDRDDDQVEFSLGFRNLDGQTVTRITQGQSFYVDVFVDDIRPSAAGNPGVFAAYMDLIYNSELVLPSRPLTGSSFSFYNRFASPYTVAQTGSDSLPGIIDELGATASNTRNRAQKVRLTTLKFDARTAGVATFFPDPAESAASDVHMNNATTVTVPEIRTRYVRSAIEVLANPTVFPQAVDDSLPRQLAVNSNDNIIRVLANDTVGANGPVRITNVMQPANGSVRIDNRGTADPSDDILRFNTGSVRSTEQFKYTIVDQRGYESTGNVTIQVGTTTGDDQVRLRLQVTDLLGNPISSIAVDEKFQLRGYVDDLRTGIAEPGLFAAFQDILFSDKNLASVDTENNDRGFAVRFANKYQAAESGDIRVPGIINELGSQQTNPGVPTGAAEQLQFIVTLTARQAGSLTFIGDPADLSPLSDTLYYDVVAPIDPSRIQYTRATVAITAAAAARTASTGSVDVSTVKTSSSLSARTAVTSAEGEAKVATTSQSSANSTASSAGVASGVSTANNVPVKRTSSIADALKASIDSELEAAINALAGDKGR
jgi:large repetitive protein